VSLAVLSAPCALISQNFDANASNSTLSTAARSLKTRFTYRASVPTIPSGTKNLRLWLPLPSDSPFQTVSNLKVTSPFSHRVTSEKKHGNRLVFVEAATPSGKLDVSVSFDVERKEIAPLTNGEKLSNGEPASYLRADMLVPIGGRFAEIADSVVGSLSSPSDKVRAIYEHTVANMQYDYNKESPKLGMGDVAFVCDYKKGNCSDLHSYMISLARSEGIPAYLEYGFPVCGIPVPGQVAEKGTIGGYHCWMWFYDGERGWLPVDASDGRRWLDSKRADVKERLFGNLVLERSAVAISKGRDLTLEPPQQAGPLNNFIYPYSEADGKSVETTWVMEYELLSPAGTLAYPSGSTQDQINELRQVVLSQQKEIATLKASAAKPAAGQVTNAAPKQSAKVYGFIRTDAIFDSQATNPNSQFPFYVESPDRTGIGEDSERFTLHPRLTRLGIDFAENEETLKGWRLGGKIEIDFQGGGSESRQTPRARHLYATLRRGRDTWLLGQTWDLISPLFPSSNDDSMMWNAGNLGDRRPQIRYTSNSADGRLQLAVAAGLTGAIDSKDLDNNGIRDGEAAGTPNLQGRIAFVSPKGQLGIWGHVAKEKTVAAVGGETNFESNSFGIDGRIQATSVLDLMGEWWTGKNLSDFRGGIGQGIDTATATEIRSSGGWVELGLKTSPRHRIAIGYTVDDPEDDDIPANGRTKNSAAYLHNKWALSEALDLGLNLLDWETKYKGMERGKAFRVNLYVAYKF